MKRIVTNHEGRGLKIVELSFIGGNPPVEEDDTDPDPTSPAGAALSGEDPYVDFRVSLAA